MDFTSDFYNLISKCKFSLESEEELKLQISSVLEQHNFDFKKEFKLDAKNRLDFYIHGYAIEVKIKGSAMSIYRQCVRYCQFKEVKGLFLITNKSMGFPTEINQKPCYLINLGKSWL
jgi:hypothetical protein